MVTKVERWETSDAKVFNSEIDAISHQKEIDFQDKVKCLTEREFPSSCGIYTQEDIMNWLSHPLNRETFRKLFA